MSFDSVHLRDEALILADCMEEVAVFERIKSELHSIAVRRVRELLWDLMDRYDNGGAVSPAEAKRLLDLLEQAKEELAMKY